MRAWIGEQAFVQQHGATAIACLLDAADGTPLPPGTPVDTKGDAQWSGRVALADALAQFIPAVFSAHADGHSGPDAMTQLTQHFTGRGGKPSLFWYGKLPSMPRKPEPGIMCGVCLSQAAYHPTGARPPMCTTSNCWWRAMQTAIRGLKHSRTSGIRNTGLLHVAVAQGDVDALAMCPWIIPTTAVRVRCSARQSMVCWRVRLADRTPGRGQSGGRGRKTHVPAGGRERIGRRPSARGRGRLASASLSTPRHHHAHYAINYSMWNRYTDTLEKLLRSAAVTRAGHAGAGKRKWADLDDLPNVP